MTTQTPTPTASQLHILKFSRKGVKKLLEGITDDKLCAQPGSCVNHALWIVGHLASTDDYFLKTFSDGKLGGKTSENWNKTFGMGSKPTSDASKYPSVKEVKKVFDDNHNAFLKWYESLSVNQLEQPTPDDWQPYAPTLADVPYFMIWHEGYHAGQLSALRKAFNLKPAFG